ncbi:MAG: preprotein translocase subunit YajC [Bacteroidaceae bacterium]|nr:preprotein translocase subunit YajC [Bacteroidaceae bacterium]
MANMLLLDPFQMTAQEVVSNHIMTLVQDTDAGSFNQSSNGQAQGGAGGGMIWMLLLVFLVMMLFMRPRQDKEGEKFRNALQKEQDVVTSTGIFGKIKDIDEVSVTVEVAKDLKIRVDKRYVNPVPTPQPVKAEKPSRRKKKDSSKEEKA